MLPTYPALLRAGTLQWESGRPSDDPVRVLVTIVSPVNPSPISGSLMANALTALAALGGPSGFNDPRDWQRETRSDRTLPGRPE